MSDFEILHGDCLEKLREIPDASIDSVVTDPPAGIGFMGKSWDSDKGGRDQWIAWLADVMRECLRVLKPGGHALVWAIPRTSHWTATAIENAGFEVRDVITHHFGTGFPKSLDVSKAIDKAAGAQREVVGSRLGRPGVSASGSNMGQGFSRALEGREDRPNPALDITAPATPDAARWSGWGTALKPASEHWILARKPLEGTVAGNVLAHGTGALNIDACRIGTESTRRANCQQQFSKGGVRDDNGSAADNRSDTGSDSGRWPANLVLDKYAAALLDEQSGTLTSGKAPDGLKRNTDKSRSTYSAFAGQETEEDPTYGDSGGASRFFYVAKPSTRERDAGLDHLPTKSGGEATGREDGSDGLNSPRAGAGRGGNRKNVHPTVKPIELMRYLCRLITPPGGIVLDPFTGSGTTGIAAVMEGFDFLGVEREAEYIEIATARLKHAAKAA